MPVSKNRRKKPKVATSAKPAKANKVAALPDRRAMEGFMASLGGRRGGDPVAAAQDVMYDAWEQSNRGKRIALARRALAISPLCSDAYVLLAEETAKSVREALVYYQKGVEAGELALGPEGFEKCAGRFWGHLETRPYMRARTGLAAALWALGWRQEAIEHYRAMLELNPNDNQGIRYLLAAQLLAQNDIEALKKLIKQYEGDGCAEWLYTQALLAFRENDPDADELAEQAWQSNNHVPAVLSNHKPALAFEDDYIIMGGEGEAAYYINENGAAWQATPGAIDWLVDITNTLKPRQRGRPAA